MVSINTKPSLLLLGANGRIGSFLLEALNSHYQVFSDSAIPHSDIFQDSFFLDNNVSIIVNCIGAYKRQSTFFHSNIYLPAWISDFLVGFSLRHEFDIYFINLSSVGVLNPYRHLNFEPKEFSPLIKSHLSLNPYEYSKLCFNLFLRLISKYSPHFYSISLQLSIVIPDSKTLSSSFKLFLLLSPFKVLPTRSPAFTTMPMISQEILTLSNNFLLNSKVIPHSSELILYQRIPLSSFCSQFYFLPFKLPFPSFLLPYIIRLINIPLLSSFIRRALFLHVL